MKERFRVSLKINMAITCCLLCCSSSSPHTPLLINSIEIILDSEVLVMDKVRHLVGTIRIKILSEDILVFQPLNIVRWGWGKWRLSNNLAPTCSICSALAVSLSPSFLSVTSSECCLCVIAPWTLIKSLVNARKTHVRTAAFILITKWLYFQRLWNSVSEIIKSLLATICMRNSHGGRVWESFRLLWLLHNVDKCWR